MPYDAAVAAVGWPEAERIWRFSLDNNRFIAQTVEELDLDCGYLRRGSMSVAGSEEEWQELRDGARALRESEIECCLVAAQDLPRPFHREFFGGLYYPGNAEMNPARFVRGMAANLADSVSIFERTSVRGLRHDSEWVLDTGGGSVRAGALILATNAYTRDLLSGVSIASKRGQVLATGTLEQILVPFPMYANHGFWYWRQTADGRLVLGGARDLDLEGEIGTDERLHDAIQSALNAFCARICGASVAIEMRWAGIMGFTPDHFPLVGAIPGADGLYIAAGFSGHGVSLALRSGMQAARLAAGSATDIPCAFDPERFA
jgi:glycine/D-amino acid oxidase-like deaminating enzyme